MPDDNRQQNAPVPSKPPAKPAEEVGLRVSLIPAEETTRRDPRRGFKRAVIAVAIAVAVMGGVAAYLGISVSQGRKEAQKIGAQAEEFVRQAASMSDTLKYAKLMQSRLRSLSSMLGSHRNAAPIFVFLEKHTLPEVSFSSMTIAENGSVNLTASASSFEAYAGQVSELRKQPEIRSLVSSGLSPSYDEENRLSEVAFTLVAEFDPAIFISKAAND